MFHTNLKSFDWLSNNHLIILSRFTLGLFLSFGSSGCLILSSSCGALMMALCCTSRLSCWRRWVSCFWLLHDLHNCTWQTLTASSLIISYYYYFWLIRKLSGITCTLEFVEISYASSRIRLFWVFGNAILFFVLYMYLWPIFLLFYEHFKMLN